MQDFEEHEAGTPTSPRHVGLLLAAVVAVAVIVFSLGVPGVCTLRVHADNISLERKLMAKHMIL